jgi:hypothetical protein
MSVFHKAAVFLMVLGLTLPSLGYAIEATPCPTGVLKDGIEQTRHVPATNWPNPTFEMPSGSYPNDRLARPFAWERRGEIGLAGSDWVYTDPLGLPGYEENRPYANDVGFVRDEDGQGRRWGWVPMQNAAKNGVEVSCDKPKPPHPPEGGMGANPEPLQISCDRPKPPPPPENQTETQNPENLAS